ncbi:hypothetical protein [Hoyosella subflava]|uniref:Uncharacterized protein n=1 Tax=Hoyosella subflava (strain DSM 45089 / JCM 17490 / NBRC 109087 / DQS3-9A1) TaxID=443218 RepID=F6EEU1_HOYSD|nr:hypothetical protein [Hoyosella subflava]AEF40891.1 hypothetical protein AS9A_2444 [Hoyosella subflava DQS3-9A1]
MTGASGGDPYPDPESFLIPIEVRQPPPVRTQRSVIVAAITLLFIAVGIGVLANSPAGSGVGPDLGVSMGPTAH